jgi:hypothetical protein
VSQTRRIPRRPGIYTYIERLGINSSFIRKHCELPTALGAPSRKKKSRHGIKIRKNKQSEGTAEGLTSRLNRTKSSQSYKVGLTPYTIPCFPAHNGSGAYYCDTISNRSLPSHFTKDSPSNISQVRTRPTTNYATAWKIKKNII